MVKNMLAEGFEEASSDVLNLIVEGVADAITQEQNSNLTQNILNYVSQGYDKKEAIVKAVGDFVKEMGIDFLGGALSGLGFAGASAISNSVLGRVGAVAESRSGEGRDALIDTGLSFGEDTKANQLAQKNQGKDLNLIQAFEQTKANSDALKAEQKSAKQLIDNYTGEDSQAEEIRENQSALEILGVETEGKTDEEVKSNLKTALDKLASPNNESLGTSQVNTQQTSNDSRKGDFSALRITEEDKAFLNRSQYEAVFNEQKQEIQEKLSKSLEAKGKEVFNSMASTTEDVTSLYGGFYAYYNAGRNGTALKNVNTKYADNLTKTQKTQAYNAGIADMKESLNRDYENVKAKMNDSMVVVNEYSKEITVRNPQLASAIASLVQKTGTKLEFTAPVEEGKVNGGYYAESNTIKIAYDTDDILYQVAKHEFTHRIQTLAPKEYNRLKQYILRTYDSDKLTTEYLKRFNQLGESDKNKSYAYSLAEDEIVAYFTDKLFNDQETFEKVVNNDYTLAEKLHNALLDLIADVKDALGIQSSEAERLQRIERLWAKALREGVENNPKEKYTVKDVEGFRASRKDASIFVKAVNSLNEVQLEMNFSNKNTDIKTIVDNIQRELIYKGGLTFVGRTFNSVEELGVAANVFRDPRYETTRYFFLDKNNKVVMNTGFTSHIPNASAIAKSEYRGKEHTEKALEELFKKAIDNGATSFYVLHNHPSGDPTPSNADYVATHEMKKIGDSIGLKLNSHIVIDHNKFTSFNVDTNNLTVENFQTINNENEVDPLLITSGTISNDDDLAKYGIYLNGSDAVVVVYANKGNVRGIQQIGKDNFIDYDSAKMILHNEAVKFGSPDVFLIAADNYNEKILKALYKNTIVTDVMVSGISYAVSKEERGYGNGKDFLNVEHEVVERFSTKDSEGNALSKAQQEYFKNSKVRDKNGALRVMYHGTRSATPFSIFDTSIESNGNNIGSHFGTEYASEQFLDEWSGYDENGEKIEWNDFPKYQVYLNITNPYDTFDWFAQDDSYPAYIANELANKLGTKEAQALLKEIENLDPYYKALFKGEDELNGNFYLRDQNGIWDKERYNVLYSNLRKLLELAGYDGISYQNDLEDNGNIDYIAFYPEQIKFTDNENPTTKKDIRYSFKGYNKYGIEVYETPKRILDLPIKEKIKLYEDMLTQEFIGRTAKFVRNGHILYAQLDPRAAEKILYGEKSQSKLGKRAIIRIGASGDIFEVVENSTYRTSGVDKKNHKKEDSFTDYFDYFYKTVQIDNKVFDINIDVKKQYGDTDGYTYTIKIYDNKKISPSSAEAKKPLKVADNELVINRITQNHSSVKDSKYLELAKDPIKNEAELRKMVEAEAKLKGYGVDSSYQGTSAFNGSAPSSNGYFFTKEERLEAWKNGEFEGDASLGDYKDGIDTNDLEFILGNKNYNFENSMGKESILNLRRGLKDGKIKMFRSVPNGVKETKFRNGDWVTPSRAYAIDNAKVHSGYPGWENGYRIIEQVVSIEDIWWDGNSVNEWGYDNGKEYAYQNTENNVKSLDLITYDDNGNIIPLSERFNKAKEDVRYSTKEYAPTFYSKMNKVIADIKQDKIGASSVIPYLKGKGVKADEIKWSGLETFLDGKKSVSKEELDNFAKANELQIEESVRSDNEEANNEAFMTMIDKIEAIHPYPFNDAVNELFDYNNDFREDRYDKKVKSWLQNNEIDLEQMGELFAIKDEYLKILNQATKWSDYKLEGGNNYREILFKMPGSNFFNQAMLTHWGDNAKGILAHARIQDFDTPSGKMLFIDEIQSDWHNQGSKFGYNSKERSDLNYLNNEMNNLAAQLDKNESLKQVVDKMVEFNVSQTPEDAKARLFNTSKIHLYNLDEHLQELGYEMPRETYKGLINLIETRDDIKNDIKVAEGFVSTKKVPEAPFKDSYTNYVLKRLLRMAAEQGYDSIGWTTGQQQEKRWSSQYAEGYRIEYDQDIPKFLNKYGKQWDGKVSKVTLENSEADVRYTDNNGQEYDSGSVRSWYDSVMDSYASKDKDTWFAYISGQTKVIQDGNTLRIQNKATGEILPEYLVEHPSYNEVWQFPITESMKESVLYEGQPRFSMKDSKGNNLTKAQQSYFANSKAVDDNGNLVVLYHGSPNIFNTFNDNDIYLTNNEKMSEGYGTNKYQLYANIKNPLVIYGEGANWDEIPFYPQDMKDLIDAGKQISDEWEALANKYWEDGYMVDPDSVHETRKIVEYAKTKGYDGVIFKDIYDYGEYEDANTLVSSDVYVAFNKNQVKSTDNLNPTTNDDIRYSRKDSKYLELAKDPSKNEKELRKMVEEAAIKAFPNSILIQNGTFRKAYHYTNKEFNSFLPGTSGTVGGLKGINFALQENGAVSSLYGKKGEYYLNVTNYKLAYGNAEGEKYAAELLKRQEGVTDRYEIAKINRQFKEETGIDAFFGWDNGWFNILTPEQIKSADLVTYDDNGNIIPLSERFNSSNTDIRNSVKESKDVWAIAEQNVKLQEKIKELNYVKRELKAKTKQAEHWKNQTKVTKVVEARTADVRKYAKAEINSMGSKIKVNEVIDDFQRLANMLKGDEVDYNQAKSLAINIARDIVENAVELNGDNEIQDNILREIRTTSFKATDRLKSGMSQYKEFKKQYFGRLHLAAEGRSIDDFYQDMKETYGTGYFPEDIINEKDQLEYIAGLLDSLQPEYTPIVPYYERADVIESLANEFIEDMSTDEIRRVAPTYADKMEAKLKQAKKEKAVALENLRQKNKEIELLKAKEVKARYEKLESEERTKLLKIAQRLSKMKTTEVNRNLIKEVIGDLDLISKSMTGKTVEHLQDLQAWYEDQKQNNPDFIPDPAIEKAISRLAKKQIADMDINDVRDLTDVLRNIENEIRNQRRLIDSQDRRDTFLMGKESAMNILSARKNKGNAVSNFILTEELSPLRQMARYTGYIENDPLYQRVVDLNEGQRKMIDYQMVNYKKFNKWIQDKDFMMKLSGTKPKFIEIEGLGNAGGKSGIVKVKINPSMRISLYLHSLNYQNMNHIAYGGITIPDVELLAKGKIDEAWSNAVTIRLTKSAVDSITRGMSANERAFANAIYDYFNYTSKKAINETSELLKGYSLASVEHYFPINTNKNFTKSEFASIKMDSTIEGMGILKERVNAKNPIYLRNVEEVLKQGIDMHSKYYGLAIPLRNFNKIWNTTFSDFELDGTRTVLGGVKDALDRVWGNDGMGYVDKMMASINGVNYNDRNALERFISKLRSNYAGAVLNLNASVALKQTASYPTAAAVIGWSPLAKALQSNQKVDIDLINKYTPLLWYRSQGFSTQELGDLKKADKQLPKALNWIQAMDIATTKKLWLASEFYVQDNTKLEKGTEAYYQEVAKVYNQVIEETQPNYTPMQRPQILRSSSTWFQNVMMFKTQVFQNFNILYNAIAKYDADRVAYLNDSSKKAQFEASKKKLVWAIESQIVQNAMICGITFAWAMLRGKTDKYKDDDEEMSLLSALKAIGSDFLSGALGSILLGAEALSSTQFFTDKSYYSGISDLSIDMINDLLNALKRLYALPEKIAEGKVKDLEKEFDKITAPIAELIGIPFSNIKNIIDIFKQWGEKLIQ